MHRLKKDTVYTIIIAIFIFVTYLYTVGRIYGFSLYPDEFGYWASAAKVLGYDWSEISSLGSYYSFGYSLILIPILFLFQSGLAAYRASIVVNMLLLLGTFLLLTKIAAKIFSKLDTKLQILFSGIAACYPVWFMYMGMTLVEIILVFDLVLVAYLLILYLEDMKLSHLILLILATAYLYTIHMRSVGIVIAVAMTIVIRILTSKKNGKKILLMLLGAMAILMLAIGITVVIKTKVQNNVYSEADVAQLNTNDYGGQWIKIKRILTKKGLYQFLTGFAGKVYYLGMSSFGLFYYGFFYALRKAFDKKLAMTHRCFYLFADLASLGSILICTIYMIGYTRIDGLMYGRYDEMVLPIMMLIGCYAMYQGGLTVVKTGAAMFLSLFAMIQMAYVIVTYKMTNLHGAYFIAGFSYHMRNHNYDFTDWLWYSYMRLFVLTWILWLLIELTKRKHILHYLLLGFIGVECLLGTELGEQHTFRYNTSAYYNLQLSEFLTEKSEETEGGRRIVSFGNTRGEGDTFISSIQFYLRDETIHLIPESEIDTLTETDLVLVSITYGESDILADRYAEMIPMGSFWLYYN